MAIRTKSRDKGQLIKSCKKCGKPIVNSLGYKHIELICDDCSSSWWRKEKKNEN